MKIAAMMDKISIKIGLVTFLLWPLVSVSSFQILTTGGLSRRNVPQTTRKNTLLFADLTSEQEHAWEVFNLLDQDNSDTIDEAEFGDLLNMLDIEASDDDALILFRYLDSEGNGKIGFSKDFLPWYSETTKAARESASNFQAIICGRRTVNRFDKTPISDNVLRRAIQCAITAPNRSNSEPWRFIQLGRETVKKLADLNKKLGNNEEGSFTRWTSIPGWCVVTCKTSDNESVQQEDYKSVSCAIQNFMLSMWSEGIGSKWTSGPVQKTKEFAELCGIDLDKEMVVGVIWYGFASGGLINAEPKQRRKGVDDVLSSLP